MPQVPFAYDQPNTRVGGSVGGQASPADFGGQVGSAMQGMGGALAQSGQEFGQVAQQTQQINNEIESNNLENWYSSQSRDLLYGNKDNPAAGKGYFNMHGQEAVDNHDAIATQLDNLRQQAVSQASNNRVGVLLDNITRRRADLMSSQMGQHFANEQGTYLTQSTEASAQSSISDAGLQWNDPGSLNTSVADINSQADTLAKYKGWDTSTPGGKALRDNWVQQRASMAARLQVENALVADTGGTGAALSVFGRNAGLMTAADKFAVGTKLHADQENAQAQAIVSNVLGVGGAAPQSSGGGVAPDLAAMLGKAGLTNAAPGGTPGQPPSLSDASASPQGLNPADLMDPHSQVGADLLKQMGISIPASGEQAKALAMQAASTATAAKSLAVVPTPNVPAPATGAPLSSDDINSAIASIQTQTAGNPALQAKAMAGLHQQITIQNAGYEASIKAQRAASESALAGYTQKMLNDPTSVSAKDIGNDPNLSPETKWALNSHLLELNKAGGSKDATTYGPAFVGLLNNALAPDGTPGKLTDTSQLVSHLGANGDLTVAGFEKLQQQIQSSRTPDGAADQLILKQFLDAQHAQISGKDKMFAGQQDPTGEDNYLRFLTTFFPAYDAQKKAGVPTAQLLSPDAGKSYLGNMATPFVRTPEQKMADMTRNNLGTATAAPVTAATTPAATLDLKSQAGIMKALDDGKIDRAGAVNAMVAAGLARPKPKAAPATLPQVPTGE